MRLTNFFFVVNLSLYRCFMVEKKNWIIRIVTIILVCCLIFCAYNLYVQIKVHGGSSAEYSQPIQVGEDEDLSSVAEKCLDACVAVYYNLKSGGRKLSGSGVAIRANGYVVTNYHVIKDLAGAANSGISIKTNSNQFYDCTLLWQNASCDVAVLKTNTNANLAYLEMADRWVDCTENQKLGLLERVIAIGTPLKEVYFNTATPGYIASQDARISSSEGRFYEDLIQHTCTLKKGNSGGALVDLAGRLVGLNTLADGMVSGAMYEDGIFMSVPIYPVMLAIDQIAYNYEHSINRLTMADLPVEYCDKIYAYYSPSIYDYNGDYVYVTKGNDDAGLLYGDEIYKIKVANKNYNIEDRNDLLFALLRANVGDKVVVYVKRGAQILANGIEVVLV